MTDESEKPKTTKLLEQGHGYAIIRLVTEASFLSEGSDKPDGSSGFETEEGYVKAEIQTEIEGGPMGVYEFEGKRYTVPLDRLRLQPPVGMDPIK